MSKVEGRLQENNSSLEASGRFFRKKRDKEEISILLPEGRVTIPVITRTKEAIVNSDKSTEEIVGIINKQAEERESLREEFPFRNYLKARIENPDISMFAEVRMNKVVSRPDFWTTGDIKIYGMEDTKKAIEDYYRAAAMGLEIRKRIPTLMGPPGSGKTTIEDKLEREEEAFTRTDAGKLYTIKGCGIKEDPLHLIPREVRHEVENKFGIHIEGDLCPDCNKRYGSREKVKRTLRKESIKEAKGLKKLKELLNFKEKSFEDVPVERTVFSIADRIGVGNFRPGDPKSQSMEELVGGIDYAGIQKAGSASEPGGFRFDGEFHVANRGVVRFSELYKTDRRMQYALLDTVESKTAKSPRFAPVSIDEVVEADSNEAEFRLWAADPTNEALHSRTYLIETKYNLDNTDKGIIGEKVKNNKEVLSTGMHINDSVMDFVSSFITLTRLEPSEKQAAYKSKVKKLKLYSSPNPSSSDRAIIRELKEETPREGMHGLSPRFGMDALSLAVSIADGENKKCVTPVDARDAIKEHLTSHYVESYSNEKLRSSYLKDLDDVWTEYLGTEAGKVQRSFIENFEDVAQDFYRRYVEDVKKFNKDEKSLDGIELTFMKSVEEQAGTKAYDPRPFRKEVEADVRQLEEKGVELDYRNYGRLTDGIERKVLLFKKGEIKRIIMASDLSEEDVVVREKAKEALMRDGDYCDDCAESVIKAVAQII